MDNLKKNPGKMSSPSLIVDSSLVDLQSGGDRKNWANPLEFVLSCVGYAVGIGNIWRFPYLVYRNGGGAFLIPFILMLLTMGMPMFFLELVIGQYTGTGPTKAYARMAPLFHGLGYCTIVVISLVTIYYMVITSWTLFYTFASFAHRLTWAYCDNQFNSINCYSGIQDTECQRTSTVFYHGNCTPVAEICQDFGLASQSGDLMHCFNVSAASAHEPIELRTLYTRVLSSEEYFNDYVLGVRGTDWEHWGGIRWELLGCLSLAWIICYFCLMKGIQSVGKIVYFTALFPYFVLIALMWRGATLEGSLKGIVWYITPRWSQLLKAGVWADAASQVFYSLGIGCGSLVTLASYSSFTNNCHRDAIFVTITNLLTSVFAGFVTFSIMGFLANQMHLPIDDVVRSSTGLAFIVFPEAVVRMPLPNLWAILFFFMLFILGLGSQFAGVQAISGAILDMRPSLQKYEARVTLVICFLGWLLGIPMIFNGGAYLFTLMDWNTAAWAILLIGFAELILPAWLYGCDRLFVDLSDMGMKFGRTLQAYWRFSWMVAGPVTALGVFAYQMYTYQAAKYGDYEFPAWADAIGILIGLSTLLPFPLFFCYRLYVGPRDWSLLRPTSLWGPVKKSDEKLAVACIAAAATCNPAFISDSQA
ncbi:sodium- and chloride-dependent GABA transporter 2-like [Phymastichus coffea]|uniref:sodium- and chloride-dependent GABA transporter 2-like n=1 Tax=Phymastichus coffea TaxID=108790 RepID=UPI00273BF2AB|nr:sodium- and chloride-dependent GABA transporter 2-like [Phymastichus coffea]